MLKGNQISYSEAFGTLDFIGCFYRFDKKKTYCPADSTFVTHSEDLMGYNVFWGKWHLWKMTTSIEKPRILNCFIDAGPFFILDH